MSIRHISVTVSHDRTAATAEFLELKCGLKSVTLIHGARSSVLGFYIAANEAGRVMGKLEELGIGVAHGMVASFPVEALKPMQSSLERLQSESVLSKGDSIESESANRIAVEEIYYDIVDGTALTFDFLAALFVASVIAGLGVATDNTVMIVASMMLSPLMGPIQGFTFGSVIRNPHLIRKGLRTTCYGTLLTFVVGCILGLVFLRLGDRFEWPTTEMTERGKITGLLVGLAFAVASGAGLALNITKHTTSSLIGVAIAASVLPPVVNSGICFSYGLVAPILMSSVDRITYLKYAGISFCLFLINVLAIFCVGWLVFKLKAIVPIQFKNEKWQELPPVHSDNAEEALKRNRLESTRTAPFASVLRAFGQMSRDQSAQSMRLPL